MISGFLSGFQETSRGFQWNPRKSKMSSLECHYFEDFLEVAVFWEFQRSIPVLGDLEKVLRIV